MTLPTSLTLLPGLQKVWTKWISPKTPTNLLYIPLVEAEVEAEEEGHQEGGSRGTNNLPTSPTEEEVEVVSEESPEEENLIGVLQKGFPEKTPRQKTPTKTDAGIAARSDIGWKTAHKRRKIRRKQIQKVPLQASVKSPKISMETNLQKCSMESLKSMKKVKKN